MSRKGAKMRYWVAAKTYRGFLTGDGRRVRLGDPPALMVRGPALAAVSRGDGVIVDGPGSALSATDSRLRVFPSSSPERKVVAPPPGSTVVNLPPPLQSIPEAEAVNPERKQIEVENASRSELWRFIKENDIFLDEGYRSTKEEMQEAIKDWLG